MKTNNHASYLPLAVLLAGLAGAAARFLLYATGLDDQGLLVRNHPLQLFCLALSVLVAGAVWLQGRKLSGGNDYAAHFPKNSKLLPLAVAAAAGMLFTVLTAWDSGDVLHLLWGCLGLACVPVLAAIGIFRARQTTVPFYLYGILCLFYGVNMICSYQLWSGNPQVEDYFFALLACACLTLAAYQRCAFSAGLGNGKANLFFSLMAGFFCLAAIPEAPHPWLYFTGGAFFLSDLSIPGKHQEG